MALREDVRRFGLIPAVLAGIFRRLEQHCGLHLWSVQTRPIYPEFEMPHAHAERFTFRRLDLEDALVAARDPALLLREGAVRTAFARGDICVGAYDGDRLVAYTWRTLSQAPVTDTVRIRLLRKSMRYGYKSLVLPPYRGMRLSHSVARFWDHNFLAMGVDHDVGYVALHNLASMRSTFREPNRKRIGYAGYIQVGDRHWSFRTRGVRDYLAIEPADRDEARGKGAYRSGSDGS